ncbi:MAG TPA: TraR/DksA C4-type zinc finger protein [Isosphaeraceae bacterium]|nr:TraR/DksA C4-type zinc finger protein [Isosphaeraceae bacterium]
MELSEGICAALRQALEQERERLRESIAFLADAQRLLAEEQAAEGSVGGTAADIATDVSAQALEAGLGEAERTRLAEVEAALARLAEGRYGRCVDCGEAIALERLWVLPWTPYCVRCALRRTGGQGGGKTAE